MEAVEGICRLCLKDRPLKRSHIWPSFVYKDYIGNLAKGGQFVSVTEEIKQSKERGQIRRWWLCHGCEQELAGPERKAAELLRTMEKKPNAAHPYDGDFLRFVTSISWRVLLYQLENLNPSLIESEIPACRYWRKFLSRKRSDLAGFSQHVFVVFDPHTDLHKILCGDLQREAGLILSQAGPFVIAGRLSTQYRDANDRQIWSRSQVRPSGSLTAINEWRVGQNITHELTSLLFNQHNRMLSAMKQHAKLRRKLG